MWRVLHPIFNIAPLSAEAGGGAFSRFIRSVRVLRGVSVATPDGRCHKRVRMGNVLFADSDRTGGAARQCRRPRLLSFADATDTGL
nr:MAG TPA: hypothetical protein [Caudoviricetes sp.]